MAYVTIHKDITKIKNTTPIGLTYSQTACVGFGGALGIAVYFYSQRYLGTNLASIVMMLVMAPFGVLGMYHDKLGRTSFQIVPIIYEKHVNRNSPRPYQSQGFYHMAEKQMCYDREIKMILKQDRKEQEQKKGISADYKPSAKAKKELKKTKKKYGKNPKKPQSSQDSIPYDCLFKNGIMKVSEGYYTKTLEFTDTTYTVASGVERASIFDNWCNLLNSFDSSVHVQLSYVNQNINKSDYIGNIDMPHKFDGQDEIRDEYSGYLKRQLDVGNNGIVKKRYMTIGVKAADFEKAKLLLNKVCTSTIIHFSKMGVIAEELNGIRRMQALWNILHPDVNRLEFNLSWEDLAVSGRTTKDVIAPANFDFKESMRLDAKNYFKIGRHIGTCSYVDVLTGDYPDSSLQEILSIDTSIIVTMHIKSLDQQKALRFVKNKLTDVNAKKIDAQQKAVRKGYDMDILPPELKLMSEDAELIFRQLSKDGQRLFHVTFTIVQLAKTKKELDNSYENLKSIMQTINCNIYKTAWQQEQCFMSALPLGVNKITDLTRGLPTSELAVFLPFNTKELFQAGTIQGRKVQPMYYGLNMLSNNMIMADRKTLKNPNGIILGVPGSGKSFAAKREIVNSYLVTDDDILILDPEGEYGNLVTHLRGQIIKLSANTPCYINPLDIVLSVQNDEDNEYDPISEKANFMSSLLEIMLAGKQGLGMKELSIIDYCTHAVYADYLANPIPENMPLLEDIYKELLKYAEENDSLEAKSLAVTMEMYVTGSYNLFNHKTNVDIDNRIVCFDIKDLTGRLKNMGMLIIQDKIWNRVSVNRSLGKSTRLYIDEFHLLLKEPQTAEYSIEMWKRFRKWGGIPTGLTQNVSDFLKSRDVENIFANSPFVLLLSQNPSDAETLAQYYGISDYQLKYCSDVEPGRGLIVFGSNCILPFKDDFPRDTKMYALLTTKLEETAAEERA